MHAGANSLELRKLYKININSCIVSNFVEHPFKFKLATCICH